MFTLLGMDLLKKPGRTAISRDGLIFKLIRFILVTGRKLVIRPPNSRIDILIGPISIGLALIGIIILLKRVGLICRHVQNSKRYKGFIQIMFRNLFNINDLTYFLI
jgi:hypothetical protein